MLPRSLNRIVPVSGVERPHQILRQRGLAATGLADQPKAFAAADLEADIVDGQHAAAFRLAAERTRLPRVEASW